ncbi:Glutamate--tRNA ligase [Scenedesmus sp. PABB004]|nr:Glutamate--tRNA ligase [Scenedesmus sp. PABB004]
MVCEFSCSCCRPASAAAADALCGLLLGGGPDERGAALQAFARADGWAAVQLGVASANDAVAAAAVRVLGALAQAALQGSADEQRTSPARGQQAPAWLDGGGGGGVLPAAANAAAEGAAAPLQQLAAAATAAPGRSPAVRVAALAELAQALLLLADAAPEGRARGAADAVLPRASEAAVAALADGDARVRRAGAQALAAAAERSRCQATTTRCEWRCSASNRPRLSRALGATSRRAPWSDLSRDSFLGLAAALSRAPAAPAGARRAAMPIPQVFGKGKIKMLRGEDQHDVGRKGGHRASAADLSFTYGDEAGGPPPNAPFNVLYVETPRVGLLAAPALQALAATWEETVELVRPMLRWGFPETSLRTKCPYHNEGLYATPGGALLANDRLRKLMRGVEAGAFAERGGQQQQHAQAQHVPQLAVSQSSRGGAPAQAAAPDDDPLGGGNLGFLVLAAGGHGQHMSHHHALVPKRNLLVPDIPAGSLVLGLNLMAYWLITKQARRGGGGAGLGVGALACPGAALRQACGRRGVAPRAAAVATQEAPAAVAAGRGPIKVRFAPSPTGNLHVGGARTALFNWLYARKVGGKFVLRVEDTDTARSTRESEEAMKADLRWLGLTWDEGPDVGGDNGPYRQSERTDIYRSYVDKLVAAGQAYPCFCTDAELEAMKAEAEAQKLPPIYRGKWATASAEEVAAEMAKGTPCCYRFRVPPGKEYAIDDVVRGRVAWSSDSLGDFVVLRSNGLPVYNFCVAVDDALMGITHVLRAEEHLPNTLRQLLVYEALGFAPPVFAHMSLILAPDKSKLSKRHGATSVGDFKAQGYLAPAMVNYLSLLGWNDGTEQEIYTVDELTQAFELERITKSAAVFDKVKLSWMNGQHLRALPEEELLSRIGQALVDGGLLATPGSPFAAAVAGLIKGSVDMLGDAPGQVSPMLAYPLAETAASEEFKTVRDDGFLEVASAVLSAHAGGELDAAVAGGAAGFKKWINALGKAQGRKGKRLFMPVRVALTVRARAAAAAAGARRRGLGSRARPRPRAAVPAAAQGRMQGPDVGELLGALALESGSDVVDRSSFVPLPARMAALQAWVDAQPPAPAQ